MIDDGWFVLGLVGIAGLIGSFFIARKLSGFGCLLGGIVWLALPFLGLAILTALETDPTLPPEKAGDNYAFALVLASLVVGTPWLLANFVGGLAGIATRKAGQLALPAPAKDAEG